MAKGSLQFSGDRIRAPRVTLGILVVLWALFALGQAAPCVDMNGDSGNYLLLAKSLRAGEGYMIDGRFYRTGPPLFPLMIAPVADWGRLGYTFMRVIVSLAGLGALLAAYGLLAQMWSGRRAAGLVLLVAVSSPFIEYCGKLRADIPFFLFSALFLAAMTRYWRAERVRVGWAALAALALGAAVMTRTAGMAFVVAAFAWLARPSLWRKDPRRCILFLAALLLLACPPIALWNLAVRAHREGGSHSYSEFYHTVILRGAPLFSLEGIGRLIAAQAHAVLSQLAIAGWAVFTIGKRTGGAFWAVVVAPLCLLGLAGRLRKAGPVEYAFCAYSLLVLSWGATRSNRLWLPVLPLLLGYMADGAGMIGRLCEEFPRLRGRGWAEALDRRLASLRGRLIPIGAGYLAVVGIVFGIASAAGAWMDCRDSVNGIVLSGSPRMVAEMANGSSQPMTVAYKRAFEVRPAVSNPHVRVVRIPYPESPTVPDLTAALQREGITHIVITRDDAEEHPTPNERLIGEALAQFLAHPNEFPVVHAWKGSYVFGLRR